MSRNNPRIQKTKRTHMIDHAGGIVFFSYFLLLTSYFTGCTYTIDGNPDVDLTEVHVSPVTATVGTGDTLILTASTLGFSNTGGVAWSVNWGTTLIPGTFAPNGLSAILVGPAKLTSQNQVAIITVTSNEDATRSVNDTISIVSASRGAFEASPSAVTLLTNAFQQFSLTSTPPPLKWEIVSGSGSISESGIYTAPTSISSDGTQTVIRAVSLADSTVFSECTITLVNASDSMLCFTRDILPTLSANCGMSGCHDPTTHAGGYNLNTYEGSIGSVRKGNAPSSRLFTAITQFNVNTRMPPAPAPAFAPAQVLKIGEWINEGAVDCQ